MITRKEYMSKGHHAVPYSKAWGSFRHALYYGDIVQEVGLDRFSLPNGVKLSDIREALEAGDEHLNTIPLKRWDYTNTPRECVKAFRDRGDSYTLAGHVSLLKCAAKMKAFGAFQ